MVNHEMTDKPVIKIRGDVVAGSAATPLVVWLVNSIFPENPMPAEVAASLGAVLGSILAYAVSWISKP